IRRTCCTVRRACAIGRRCSSPAPPGPPRSWYATSSAASPTWTRTGAGCWRSSTPTPGLQLLHPLAEALEEARERRILLHFDAQVTHPRVVEGLAGAVIDRELTRAENLQRLLQSVRATALARTHLGAGAALGGLAHGAARRHLRRRLGWGRNPGVACRLLPTVQQRRPRDVRPVVVDELELVRGTRAGCDRSRPRRGLHVLIRRARLLLGAHRHHGDRGEFRAHVVGDLLGGDGVAEIGRAHV